MISSSRYDPRAYWQRRAERDGMTYVGPGGDPRSTERQQDEFGATLASLLGRTVYGTALDFGCGSGRLTGVVAGYARRYIGADISAEGIALAEQRRTAAGWPASRVEFVHLPEDRLPLESASVSLLVAVTVFQHIVYEVDWRRWAAELSRVMMPGAHAAVIDAGPSPNSAPHMRRRTVGEVAAALGMGVAEQVKVGGHWAALLERGG